MLTLVCMTALEAAVLRWHRAKATLTSIMPHLGLDGLGLHQSCVGNIIFDLVINMLPGSRCQNVRCGLSSRVRAIREREREKLSMANSYRALPFYIFAIPTRFHTYPQMHHLKAAQIIMGMEPSPVNRKIFDVLPGYVVPFCL